jgi:hypothetical protein
MSLTYSQACIDARLQAVADNIDGGGSNGSLVLIAGAAAVSTVRLALPCGDVNGGVLTFASSTPLIDPAAAATGVVTTARIQDSSSAVVVSDLSVGIPGSTADVVIANNRNSTLITAGQTVSVLAAQISGS